MNPTRDELYARAQALDIEGRSEMDKDELEAAVAKAEGDSDAAPAPEGPRDPLRPADTATGSRTAPPPPPADQPGVGRPALDRSAPGPRPNLDVNRVGAEVDRRRARARADAEAAASASTSSGDE